MPWKNRKVLVTGAGGFIGSHLTELLVDFGAKVTAFIRYNSRNDSGFIKSFSKRAKERLKIYYGDLRELNSVKEPLKGQEFVFHLAALPGIPYSYTHPHEVIETNAMGTLNILTSLCDSKTVKKIVVTSTSEVYGTARYVPIDETHPLQAQSPYAASKIASDKIAESFYKSFGLPVAIARPFNTFGPRQSTRAIIPTIITQALTQKTVCLGDTLPTRDFTFVKDIAHGFIRIAETPLTTGEVINLGSGKEISISDLTETIIQLTKREVKIKVDKERVRPRNSEVQRLLASNKKAKEILDWEPKYNLVDGLRITIGWIRENLKVYQPGFYHI